MAIFRVYFDSLRRQAREEHTFFKSRPTGGNWETLKADKRLGNFRLISKKPITISYGETTYLIAGDYVEIDIPAEKYAGMEAGDIFISSRIGITLGLLGMVNVKQILHRMKRHKWVGGELIPFPRTIGDTDAFGRPFELIIYRYVHLDRLLRYVHFRPHISESLLIKRMMGVLGVGREVVKEHISKAKLEGYLKEITYEVYPKRYWDLLAVKLVSEAEGKYSFTALESELGKYGLTRRESFDNIWESIGRGWIDTKRRRLFTTALGKAELPKLVKPRIRKGLIVTALGRKFIFKRGVI